MFRSLGGDLEPEHWFIVCVREGGDVLYSDVLDRQLLHGRVEEGTRQAQVQDVLARQLANLYSF